jgi:hypothetical protein
MGRRIVPGLVRSAAGEVRQRTPAVAVKAYAALLVVAAALPLSFSLEAPRLKEQVHTAVFVPFGNSAHEAAAVVAAQRTGNERALGYIELGRLKRWSRWGAEALSFVLLAWLLYPYLRFDYEFSRGPAAAMTLWLGGLLGLGLSLLQFPVISRGLDSTDIVFRWTGLAAGLLTCGAMAPWADPSVTRGAQIRRWRRVLRAGGTCAFGFIVYNGVIPFRYQWSGDSVAEAVSADSFVPFVSYFLSRFDVMTADVVEKVAAFGVLAALLAMRHASGNSHRQVGSWAPAIIGCTALAGAVEFVQMFNPMRVPSLTDPILAALGAVLGVLALRYASRFYSSAAEEAEPPMRRAALGPVDELIATLAEPYEKAPAEPDVRSQVPHGNAEW